MDVKYHCLDDELASLYHQFKKGHSVNNRLVSMLLNHYKPKHKTNFAQLRRIGVDEAGLLSQSINSLEKNLSLEELAETTIFKYILSASNNTYPYRSLENKNFQSEVLYSFKSGDDRKDFIEHFESLLKKAKNVTVSDKYLISNSGCWQPFFGLFKNCNIYLSFDSKDQSFVSNIKCIVGNSCRVTSDSRSNYSQLHDRYILIDDKVELVITSGIDYIFDTTKECTVIMRLKSH